MGHTVRSQTRCLLWTRFLAAQYITASQALEHRKLPTLPGLGTTGQKKKISVQGNPRLWLATACTVPITPH